MSERRGMHPDPDGHEALDELAVGWALHALEPEDEVVFAAHLPGCSRCARTVAETAEVMGALAHDLPPAEPSEGLRERLRAAVEETEQVAFRAPGVPEEPRPSRVEPPARDGATAATGFPGYRAPAPVSGPERPPLTGRPAGPADPRPAWRRVLPNALVAAAVAAILGLGTWNVVLSDARDQAVEQAAEQARVVNSLLEPGTAVAPLSGDDGLVATVVAGETGMQVVARGLPVNDRDSETYVVWGTTEAADPVPLGTFDVVRSQTDVRTVGSTSTGLDEYDGYAISIEPGREAPSSPTVVVAMG